MASGKYEVVGDTQKLSKGPLDMNRTSFKGGQVQMVGDKINLKQNATPQVPSGGRDGERQVLGDTVSLNRNPQKGWNSASTPMSKNKGSD